MAPANPTGNPNFNLKNRPDRNKSGPELATFMEGQHIIKATFSLVTFSLATLKKVTFGLATFSLATFGLATFSLATFSLATLCGCSKVSW
jgi:uncharacterized protein YjbI with pentapeptide repeats